MLRSASFLPLLACFLLAATPSEAQTNRRPEPHSARSYGIEGTIRDASNNATLERVRVELVAEAGEIIATTFTDANGKFEFPNVPSGSYSLRAHQPGYATLQESVDLSFSARRGLDLTLKRDGSGQPQSSAPSISAHELSIPQPARQAMEKGKQKLYGKKDPGGSLTQFERAVKLAPKYYEAYYEMAVAQWQLGRREEAEKNIRRSIEMSGDNYAGADLGLGAMLMDQKQYAEAEKILRRAVQLEPASWLGHYELGRALVELNRADEAQASAEQARRLKPDWPLVYRLLAGIHLQQKNNAALAEDLAQYVKLDPNSPTGIRAKQMLEDLRQQSQKQETAVTSPPKPQ